MIQGPRKLEVRSDFPLPEVSAARRSLKLRSMGSWVPAPDLRNT